MNQELNGYVEPVIVVKRRRRFGVQAIKRKIKVCITILELAPNSKKVNKIVKLIR